MVVVRSTTNPRRKALHQFDPPDLAVAFAEAATCPSDKEQGTTKTVKGLELEEAQQRGLLVDLGGVSPEESPTSVACRSDQLLDQWEAKRDDLDDAVLDDSDDELL